jgi:IMP dehydrogenase
MSKINEIKEALTFDDVLLVPQYSEILPNDVKLKTKLTKNIELNVPLISAAMDTVTENETAIALAMLGGIGIIHKNLPIEGQAKLVRKVKRYSSWIIQNPLALNPEDTIGNVKELIKNKGYSSFPVVDEDKLLIGILTNRDIRSSTNDDTLVKQAMVYDPIVANENITKKEAAELMNEKKIEKLLVTNTAGKLKGMITLRDIVRMKISPNACVDKNGRLRVGAAIGPNDLDRAKALVAEDVDVIVIDTAHGHSKNVIDAIKKVKKMGVDVIAGNIATGVAAKALIDAGADALKVGIGPGSICTTRVIAGVGVPQIYAIEEVCQVAKKSKIPVIADGGIRYSGDIAKAIGIGASSVMMGSVFAGTEESPGRIVYVGGRKYKQYRGMGSINAMMKGSKDRYGQKRIKEANKLVAEGVEGIVPYKGTIQEVVYQMLGGLKSAMGYSGCQTIDKLRINAKFIKITNAGLKESHPHEITITQESPNYSVKN